MKIDAAEYVRSAHRREDFLHDGKPEIAFVGRSNVGKSSLINKLLGRRGLARTSSTPGRTQAVNYFVVNRRFYFIDLPGYGYAKAGKQDRAAWARLVDLYFLQLREPPLIVLLVDAKVGPTDLDFMAKEYFESLEAPIVVVATKADKVKSSHRLKRWKTIRQDLGIAEEAGMIPVSAESGDGLKSLWQVLDTFLQGERESHRQHEGADG